jgi:hypothetical protein
MAHPATRILTFAFAATLSIAGAGAQAVPNQSGTAATTPTNVARVYVQTAKGVNVYTASSTGNLTLVSGSPFTTSGLMIGIAGGHLITASAHYLHSYAITSAGKIGEQVARKNPGFDGDASGSCGNLSTDGGTVDRTGAWAYIRLDGVAATCDVLQNYKINFLGEFVYAGAALASDASHFPTFKGPLVISGNNQYAYSLGKYGCENDVDAFSSDASGAMRVDSPLMVSFPLRPNGGVYFPVAMASDNQNVTTGRMAIALQVMYGTCDGFSPPVLASYNVDHNGNLYYSGPWVEPAVNPESIMINPQGNLLAVGGSGPSTNNHGATESQGLQVFHFNKGKIIRYSTILTQDPIHSVAWDKSHHLYATSHARHKLYVFTITPRSITPVAGSPFTLSAAPSTILVQPF